MRSNLMIAAVVCLTASSSMIMASNTAPAMLTPDAGNGYITIGRSVVVLPVLLQAGDQLELFNMHGTEIVSKSVGIGYLSQNLSTIPEGLYTLVIERDHNVISKIRVPIA